MTDDSSELHRNSQLPSSDLETQQRQLHVCWSNKLEDVTRIVGENSQGYKFMHIEASRNNMRSYEIFMYLSICFGPLSAVITGIGISLQPDAPTLFPIISGVVAFVAGIFTTIVKFGKFDQSASSHKLAASKYTSLESNVRRQLTLPRDIRIDSVNYIHWLNTAYDELFMASPLIPDIIVRRYNKNALKSGISTPTKQHNIITINTDYENNTIADLNNCMKIKINLKPDDVENVQGEEKRLSNTTNIKRTGSFLPFSELNQYSDGMMNYEMNRMIRFK